MSHAAREAAIRTAIHEWAEEQVAKAPPLREWQRAILRPLLDCTDGSVSLRRRPTQHDTPASVIRPPGGGEGNASARRGGGVTSEDYRP
jgi:hypothetical protein